MISGCSIETSHNTDDNGENSVAVITDNQEDISQSSNNVESDEKSGVLNFIIGFFRWILSAIIVLIISMILFFVYRNYRNGIDNINRKLRNLETWSEISDKKNRKQIKILANHKDEISDLKKEIRHLKLRLREHNNSDTSSYLSIEESNDIKRDNKDYSESMNYLDELSVEKDKTAQNKKYFSVPDNNGRFEHRRASDTLQGKRIYYSIIYSEDSNVGDLHYNQGKMDNSAIDQRDSILKPVCNIQNPEIAKPTKIHQIKPGKAELSDGFWKVREKIQIEFQ